MRNVIILIFIFNLFRCVNDQLNVKVVTVKELYSHIIENNSSTLVLLNIWSTSCMPCIEEFPYIVNLSEYYDDSKLDIKFLSTDWDENSEDVENFLIGQNVLGQHYRKKEGNDQDFINGISPSWSGVLPFTGIFNKELNLISFWEGKRDQKFFINKIDSLLELKGDKI
tara:strand:- start:107 stop:610 length:504 start_codon:yes stop_codon:yes gene_type:complete